MTKIVIDGNIGAGKTSQLDMLEKQGYRVKREPIEQWPLELFYSNPERWGFLFQMKILQTLTCDDDTLIYERCPQSSHDVFWKLMKKTQEEDDVYNTAYKSQGWGPDVYIYIHTPPQVCKERINIREQSGDWGVDLKYLKDLNDKYLDMYNNLTCKKHMIDGTMSQYDILKKITTIIKQYA